MSVQEAWGVIWIWINQRGKLDAYRLIDHDTLARHWCDELWGPFVLDYQVNWNYHALRYHLSLSRYRVVPETLGSHNDFYIEGVDVFPCRVVDE